MTAETADGRDARVREARLRGARNGSRKAAHFRREYARQADQRYGLVQFVVGLRVQGRSLQAIADELSGGDIRTRWHCRGWHPAQVQRILRRALDGAEETIARLEAEARALRQLVRMEAERGGRL